MGLFQHLTLRLGPFLTTRLTDSTGSCVCPLYSGVHRAPWKGPALPCFHPGQDGEPRELRRRARSRGDTRSAAAPRPHARSRSCGRCRCTLRARGQGHPAANPASTLTHCAAVGKSANLPDSHWEEPMFIIPSREPISVVSGLRTAVNIFSSSGPDTARNREHLRLLLAEVPRAPRLHAHGRERTASSPSSRLGDPLEPSPTS